MNQTLLLNLQIKAGRTSYKSILFSEKLVHLPYTTYIGMSLRVPKESVVI